MYRHTGHLLTLAIETEEDGCSHQAEKEVSDEPGQGGRAIGQMKLKRASCQLQKEADSVPAATQAGHLAYTYGWRSILAPSFCSFCSMRSYPRSIW